MVDLLTVGRAGDVSLFALFGNHQMVLALDVNNILRRRRNVLGDGLSGVPGRRIRVIPSFYEAFFEGPLSFSIILTKSARDCACIFSIARLR
jgi:hypothetical protein